MSRMLNPAPGDVLIRNAAAGFTVVDATTHRELGGPFSSIVDAATTARVFGFGKRVWRENLDVRGRPLGPPFPLELAASTLD